MEDTKEFSNKPETPLDEKAFLHLTQEVNKAGNRTLKTVLKQPFPIIRAHLDRINEIVRNLPPEIQKAPGVTWMKVDAFFEGLFNEIGVGFRDAIWDTITLPINAFVPQLRHPNFKKQYAELHMPHVSGQTYGDKIRLWITPGGRRQMEKGASSTAFNLPSTPTPIIPTRIA